MIEGRSPKTGAWGAWRARFYALTHRASPSNAWIVDQADLASSDRVLDIGCGPGVAVGLAAPKVARAVGLDPTPGLITIARRRNRRASNVEFRIGSADDLPFEDAAFTVVWAIASLHHWPDPETSFAEIYRVLSPGGRLLLAEWRIDSRHGHGLNSDGAIDVAARLGHVGLDEVSVDATRIGSQSLVVIRATRSGRPTRP